MKEKRMSPAAKIIHRLAIFTLIVYVIQSFSGMPQSYRMASHSEPPSFFFSLYLFTFLCTSVFLLALWILFVWRFWKRPHNWSLWLGIFLSMVLAFQIFLWTRAIHDPNRPPEFGSTSVWAFVPYEIPLAATIVLCFLLRWKLTSGQRESSKIGG